MEHLRLRRAAPRRDPDRALCVDLRTKNSHVTPSMSSPSETAVGIDLGTTYSAIAYLDDLGRPLTLVNAEGDKLTPSAVLFEEDEAIVGKEALKALATEAEDVAQCTKRELGARFFHKPLAGRQYPPEAIMAWVLLKLRQDAAHQIGPISKAVITVPAYFDEVRRKATQDAGYIAGLKVLDIINEPTAAAVAFGFRQNIQNPDNRGRAGPSLQIVVYDLGGGTFDVTVLEVKGTQFTALATDGDVALGGYDWDRRLVDLVAEQFMRKYTADPREDPNTLGRLWRECEDAKRTLSARQQASIACDYQGQAVRVQVSRSEFEDATRDLLERTAFTTTQTLEASGLTWDQIERVLLVGGSTRMPAVRKMLRDLSGKEPDVSISPDEAVAHGAALRAGFLLSQAEGARPRLQIQNVNSHSLGVVGTDAITHRLRNGILIPRNTRLPVTSKRVFKTKTANQRSILIPIVEGESASPEDCVPLGECIVQDLPPQLPSQTPIEVRFSYEENGRLAIKVAVEGTDARMTTELKRETSMSQEELDRWRLHVSKLPPEA